MVKGYQEMLDEADRVVHSLLPDEIVNRLDDDDLVMVDIRDPRELEREGVIAGAFHAPRGMLEFWIDPESPYHKPRFAEGKTYVFYCASGWRSLLAAKLAQEMGLDARSLKGGISGWKAAGHPVESREAKG